MKTYAIGDLHGRLDLLLQALKLAEHHAAGQPYKFVVCGDFVDRGPNSFGIIHCLMRLQGLNDNDKEFVVLKGNHEDMMLQCLNRTAHMNWWVANGGGATLWSYGYRDMLEVYDKMDAGMAVIPNPHQDWLRQLPLYHIDEQRAFVHAGFNENLPLDQQDAQYMMWRYDRDRQPNYQFQGRHVVHGHVEHEDGPFLLKHTTNLDTVAWYTGRLAIGVFEGPGGPKEVLWAIGEPHRAQ